ncbi:MAG TPA: efflux RND transporter periplasmic adaptor subunit [Rhizomicrobium sp.]|jgi:multidrug efflux system membrane fusion protein|nr:efflux RND transporter periplasmic adaptor subunit [Rhizomicrobium sp.]
MALHETLRIAEDVPHNIAGRLNRLGTRSRWILYGLGAAVLLFIVWELVAPLFATRKKPPPAPPVKVGVAVRKDVTVMQNTIGTVVSPAMVQVTAQVTGKLLVANFREGDIVHKGDVLFQIDPAPYEAALGQAQGQLARDDATLANDRVDLSRYQALMKQNAIAEQQVATQEAKVKSDQGVVVTDKAAVDAARINLAYTRITSPVDGKTGPIFIQPGNVIPAVSATSQPLVTITQIQPIKVSFQLPQNGLAQIQNQYNQHRLMAVVPIAGVPGGSEKAPVDFVSNIVSATTGTIELRADFPNTDMRLVPGQTVTVAATINQISGATVVPRDAVNLGPDSAFVLVVRGGKAYSQTVKVLNDDGVNDAIQGDVKPGDKVVTDGQLRVTSGQAVRVTRGQAAPRPSDAEP